MILQSLNQLYHRLKDEEEYNLPTTGYSVQNITFRIVLNPDGSLVDIQDARETLTETTKTGKIKSNQVPKPLLVPDMGDHTNKPKGFFLCDKISYLTGYTNEAVNTKLAAKHFEASKLRHLSLKEKINTDEYNAICRYFESFSLSDHLEKLQASEKFTNKGVGVFRVIPSQKYAHECPRVRQFWDQHGELLKFEGENQKKGQCLVLGENKTIARKHQPKIRGFGKDQPLIVSFQGAAYTSYTKKQSYNSPVSEEAVFAYCNALNSLLSGPQSHRHRVTIGEVTTIFWTEQKTTTESLFASLLDGKIETSLETTENQTLHNQLHALLSTLRKGGGTSLEQLEDDPDTKFYILGLGKMNKSRLAVRFWHVGTLGQMLTRLADHYQNLTLACKKERHPFYEPEFPSVQRLLDQTARPGKSGTISPILGGQLMQAILHGTPYPMTLLSGTLSRIRCVENDQQGKAKERVSYLRAAILKAFLNRNHLIKPNDKKMTEAIDPSRTESAYHLGRLFAVYETAQKSAQPGINRTIRETMYSSASATPLAVFGRLERLHHHHTAKKSHPYGSSHSYADLVAEIQQHFKGGSTPYPPSLNIIDQSLFAVGYYHQLQHFRDLAEAKKQKST